MREVVEWFGPDDKRILLAPSKSTLLDQIHNDLENCCGKIDGLIELLSEDALADNRKKFLRQITEYSRRLSLMVNWNQQIQSKNSLNTFEPYSFNSWEILFRRLNPYNQTTGRFSKKINWQYVGLNDFERIELHRHWAVNMFHWLMAIFERFRPDYTHLVLSVSRKIKDVEGKIDFRIWLLFKDAHDFEKYFFGKSNELISFSATESNSLNLTLPHYLLAQMGAQPEVVSINLHSIQLQLQCADRYFRMVPEINSNGSLQDRSCLSSDPDLIQSCFVTFDGLPPEQEEFIRVTLPPRAELFDYSPKRLFTTNNLPLVIFERSSPKERLRKKVLESEFRETFRISCTPFNGMETQDHSADAKLVWPFDQATLTRALIQVLD